MNRTFSNFSAVRFLLPICVLVYCLPPATAKIPNLQLPEASTPHSASQEFAQISNQSFTDLNTTPLEVHALEITGPQKNSNAISSLSLENPSDNAYLNISASEQTAFGTDINEHSSKEGFLQTEGLWSRTQSMVLMLAAIAIPPTLAISLLFYTAHRRNKRSSKHVNKHPLSQRHGWQG